MPEAVRYAIYTRQSAADPGNVLSSCDVQFGMCQDFVRARAASGWTWIGERLDDVGHSGADMDRPGLQRLLQLVRQGKVEKVAVYRLDRLTRSMWDSLQLLDAFRKADVELLIVTAPELGSAATDRFLLNIMGAFAEFEREMIKSRLADARQRLKRQGRRIAGPPPYGYDAHPKTKQLVPNLKEAGRVEAIFQMAADGMLPRDIAAAINETGWRTRRYVAKSSGKEHGGNPWTPRHVLDVLANPVYIGYFRDGDDVRPGRHRPIVTRQLWDMARDRVEARRTSTGSRRQNPTYWPLRGKVVCTRCGRTMSTHGSHHRNFIYRYYRCRSHAGGRPPCKGSSISAFELEKGVAEMLAEPASSDSSPDLEAEDGQLLSRFRVAWGLLEFNTRLRLLPEVIQEVRFYEAESRLQLRLDMDAVRRITSGDGGEGEHDEGDDSAAC